MNKYALASSRVLYNYKHSLSASRFLGIGFVSLRLCATKTPLQDIYRPPYTDLYQNGQFVSHHVTTMPADVGNTHSKSSEAAEKAKHVTGSMLSTLVAGALEVLAGASAAVKGSMLAYSRPKVRHINYKFAKLMVKYTFKWYIILAAGLAASWPATLPILVMSPGWIINLFLLVPLWAVADASENASEDIITLFVEGMYTRDKALARAIEKANEENALVKPHHAGIVDRMKKSYYTSVGSAAAWGLSCIPGLGIFLGPATQWGLSGRSFGWSVCKPYLHRCLGYSSSQELEFIQNNVLRVIGFGSVFVLIGSIPFVGAFFISMGGCAVPHFFDNEMIQEGHNKFNTGDSIPMQDMQKKSMQ